MIPSVGVLEWAAWAPGVSTQKEWFEFFRTAHRSKNTSDPDMSDVPPMLRRRMSPLTRMALATGTVCCRQAGISPSDVHVVFASRHGEMTTTVNLLHQMTSGEALSPMDFSSSVHHTALGYFSIATANRRRARAVAGGEASFAYGCLDAMGLLADTQEPVLVITADDVLPAPFAQLTTNLPFPYAAAVLLGRPDASRATPVTLDMPPVPLSPHSKTARTLFQGIPALDFLKWLREEKKPLEWFLSDRLWRWEK